MTKVKLVIIIQDHASICERKKKVQDNKLIMIRVTIQRRVTTIKIAKEIMSKRNSQTHQALQPTP